MRSRRSLPLVFLVLAVVILSGNAFAAGPTEKVIYSFLGTPDGAQSYSRLVADTAGNLYGTTSLGGQFGGGTVFELSPPPTAGGAWTETILFSFPSGDGSLPGGGLIFDKLGNLYGTTSAPPNNTVFELSPPSTPGGAWTHTVIWTFSAYPGGSGVGGNLVMDANGNLYGTTYQLGTDGVGLVFELISPKTSGEHWAETVLYNFGAFAGDGVRPVDGLLLREGVLYGTTYYGGASGKGTVFQLVRKSGLWTETILHNFAGGDGSIPAAGVIAGGAGNLYGTTSAGGSAACACGTVYEVSPPAVAGDPWQETTLYSFTGHGDGGFPAARLWRNKSGKLYGTTLERGKGFGTVFEVKPPSVAGEPWSFVFIHDFSPSDGDAAEPHGGLTFLNGALYGTTRLGGGNGQGAIYSVAP